MPSVEAFQAALSVAETSTAGAILDESAPAPRRLFVKRAAMALALLAGSAAVGYYGYHCWTTRQYLESTDDAYAKADYTTIASKVSGCIAEGLVSDSESARAGQVLARINDRDLRAALGRAQAEGRRPKLRSATSMPRSPAAIGSPAKRDWPLFRRSLLAFLRPLRVERAFRVQPPLGVCTEIVSQTLEQVERGRKRGSRRHARRPERRRGARTPRPSARRRGNSPAA
jgi:hypothetical protein